MKRVVVLCFLLVQLLGLCASGAGYCRSVSPRMWWAGMRNAEVQLMLYGKGVGQCGVAVEENVGVGIARVERTAHPDYLFVYLDTKEAREGTFAIMLSASTGCRFWTTRSCRARQTRQTGKVSVSRMPCI